MPEKLEACFERLQSLDIVPTISNMETLLQTLYDIREVYQKLKAMESDDDAGKETDTE